MRTYTIQRPPLGGPAVVLPEGFDWGAFVFGPLWFLWHRLWLSALLLVLVQASVSMLAERLMPGGAVAGTASFAVSVLVGFNARDWWRLMLDRQGYAFAGVVLAPSLDKAEWTLMERAYADSVTA
jgi:hypothetical protein